MIASDWIGIEIGGDNGRTMSFKGPYSIICVNMVTSTKDPDVQQVTSFSVKYYIKIWTYQIVHQTVPHRHNFGAPT